MINKVLPFELFVEIFKYIPPKEILLSIRFTCKTFWRVCDHEIVWENVVLETFRSMSKKGYLRYINEFDEKEKKYVYRTEQVEISGFSDRLFEDVLDGCDDSWKKVYFFFSNLAKIGIPDKKIQYERPNRQGILQWAYHEWITKDEYDDAGAIIVHSRRNWF